jgi:hypothetical protein
MGPVHHQRGLPHACGATDGRDDHRGPFVAMTVEQLGQLRQLGRTPGEGRHRGGYLPRYRPFFVPDGRRRRGPTAGCLPEGVLQNGIARCPVFVHPGAHRQHEKAIMVVGVPADIVDHALDHVPVRRSPDPAIENCTDLAPAQPHSLCQRPQVRSSCLRPHKSQIAAQLLEQFFSSRHGTTDPPVPDLSGVVRCCPAHRTTTVPPYRANRPRRPELSAAAHTKVGRRRHWSRAAAGRQRLPDGTESLPRLDVCHVRPVDRVFVTP